MYVPSDVEDGDDVVAGDALDGPGDDLLDLPLPLLLVVRRALPVLVLVLVAVRRLRHLVDVRDVALAQLVLARPSAPDGVL